MLHSTDGVFSFSHVCGAMRKKIRKQISPQSALKSQFSASCVISTYVLAYLLPPSFVTVTEKYGEDFFKVVIVLRVGIQNKKNGDT